MDLATYLILEIHVDFRFLCKAKAPTARCHNEHFHWSQSVCLQRMSSKDILTTCLEAVQKSILSVGSGDGSQQKAIVEHGLKNLQVTFYDSRAQLLRKYPPSKRTIVFLEKECKYPPRFRVDAADLDQLYPQNSFDLIFFTFPHTGISNNDPHCVQSNQRLLRDFLRSASKLLKPDGEIQITLKNGEHYDRWNLPELLNEAFGLQLQSNQSFDRTMFPGYKHRLTNGMQGAIKEVPDRKGARVFVFGSSVNRVASSKDTDASTMLAGRLLTIFQPPLPKGWSDDNLWTELYLLLESFCAPGNVLEIRRRLDPTPDTRQLNRVLYAMERASIAKRHPPNSSSKNKKPRWTLMKD